MFTFTIYLLFFRSTILLIQLNIMKDDRGAKYINVDTGTLHGLDKAIQLGLGSFNGVELISTPYIYNATRLFSKDQKGRIFLMMRCDSSYKIHTLFLLKCASDVISFAFLFQTPNRESNINVSITIIEKCVLPKKVGNFF